MKLNGEVKSIRLNVISNQEYNSQFTATCSYSKSRFGRDAELIIALNMMSLGWYVKLSKGSRGPVDLFATKWSKLWYIQIKASSRAPRIKSREIDRLIDFASADCANPVVATLQPIVGRDINRMVVSKFMKQEQNQKHYIYEGIHSKGSLYSSINFPDGIR